MRVQSNQFVNYSTSAVNITEIGGSNVSVLNNNLNQSGTPATTNAIGIQVQNVNRVATALTITGNIIDRTRLGIWIVNTTIDNNNNPNHYQNIGFNTITFSQSAALITGSTNVYSGIKIQSVDKVHMVGNTIVRGGGLTALTGTNSAKLQGIRIENCKKISTLDNAMHDMGQGFYCSGNNISSYLYCNSLKNCYDGIMLEAGVSIGNQYTTQTNPAQNKTSDDKWQGSLHFDINGTSMASQTNWFYRNTAPFIPTRPPIFTFLNFQVLSAPGATCNSTVRSSQTEESLSITEREEEIKPIVQNLIAYNDLPFENQYVSREFAFERLKRDSLLELGTPDDSVYQNFYNEMSNSNPGLFSEVQDLSEQYDISTALNKNSSIVPACLMEQNRQTVNDIYINTWLSGVDTFTLAQQSTLEDIAYQNPMTGGVAVYSARVLLKLEVNDETGQLRSNMVTDELSLFGKFYPNPATNSASLNYQLVEGQVAYLELFDIRGEKMADYTLTNENNKLTISSADLHSGIYLYRIMMNGAIAGSGKLVILK